jgi:hypothetical protein
LLLVWLLILLLLVLRLMEWVLLLTEGVLLLMEGILLLLEGTLLLLLEGIMLLLLLLLWSERILLLLERILLLLERILLLLEGIMMLLEGILLLLERVWSLPLLAVMFLSCLWFLVDFLLLALDLLIAIFVSLGRCVFLLRGLDRYRKVDDVFVIDHLLANGVRKLYGFLLSAHDDPHTVVDLVGPERSPYLLV